MSDNWVLGIDFGPIDWTSYVAKVEQQMIVPDERGNRVIDACIYIRDDEIVIGTSAQQLAQAYSGNVIYYPLNFLNSDIQNNQIYSGLKVENSGEKTCILLPFSTSEEKIGLDRVIVECLKKLYELSIRVANKKPCLTVLSVPETVFADHHDFLLRCAHKAQIPYPSIIPRTEGILSYIETTLSFQPQERICIMDLPSDKATMSIVTVQNKLYHIQSSDSLGCALGEMIDSLLFEYILREAGKQVGKEVQTSIKAQRKIRKEIEGCKDRLSNTMTASIMIESLFDGLDFRLSLTRSRFDIIIHSAVTSLLSSIQATLNRLSLQKEEITQVIVVGRTSQIPSIQEAVKKFFGEKVVIPGRCGEVVAEGAAIHGINRREYQMTRDLPSLKQVKKDIKIRVGAKEYVVIEKETVVPIDKRRKWVVEEEESVLAILCEDEKIGEIPLKENASGKEMNVHIKGSSTEGICLTIQIPNEEEFTIHIQEEVS